MEGQAFHAWGFQGGCRHCAAADRPGGPHQHGFCRQRSSMQHADTQRHPLLPQAQLDALVEATRVVEEEYARNVGENLHVLRQHLPALSGCYDTFLTPSIMHPALECTDQAWPLHYRLPFPAVCTS